MPDFTKIKIPVKIYDNCTVIDISSGSFPRYIDIRMPGTDGARRTAIWDGLLNLANDDKVSCQEYPGNPILRIVGYGGDQDASADSVRVTQIWESDLGAIAAESDASGVVTFHDDIALDDATAHIIGVSGNKPDLGNVADTTTYWGSIFMAGGEQILSDGSLGIQAAASGEVVFNDTQDDVDFRVETDNESNTLFIQGSDGFIGIGTTPTAKLQLTESYSDSTTHTAVNINQTWSPSTTSGNVFPTAMDLRPTYDTTHSPAANSFLTSFRLFANVADSGAIRIRNVDLRSSNNGSGTIAAVDDIFIRPAVNDGGGAITEYRAIFIGNTTAATTNYGLFQSGADMINVFSGDVRIGSDTAGATLLVDQISTTAAEPVLHLVQADISEEFIRFQGSAAAATLTQSIVAEADVSTATRAGFVKIYVRDDGNQITDQAYFVPIYTLA